MDDILSCCTSQINFESKKTFKCEQEEFERIINSVIKLIRLSFDSTITNMIRLTRTTDSLRKYEEELKIFCAISSLPFTQFSIIFWHATWRDAAAGIHIFTHQTDISHSYRSYGRSTFVQTYSACSLLSHAMLSYAAVSDCLLIHRLSQITK